MAFFPCDVHGTMFRGAASHFYPAIVRGQDSDREHMRVCQVDAASLLSWADAHASRVTEGTQFELDGPSTRCLVCDLQSAETDAFFLTAYPKGEEERQYYGRVCPEHIDDLKRLLSWPARRARPAAQAR